METEKEIQEQDGWVKLPKLPIVNENNFIYSKGIIFKTKGGTEYIGWVRFDFAEFIVKGKALSFEYHEVEFWKYE